MVEGGGGLTKVIYRTNGCPSATYSARRTSPLRRSLRDKSAVTRNWRNSTVCRSHSMNCLSRSDSTGRGAGSASSTPHSGERMPNCDGMGQYGGDAVREWDGEVGVTYATSEDVRQTTQTHLAALLSSVMSVVSELWKIEWRYDEKKREKVGGGRDLYVKWPFITIRFVMRYLGCFAEFWRGRRNCEVCSLGLDCTMPET
jgi:hypothetical protein